MQIYPNKRIVGMSDFIEILKLGETEKKIWGFIK